MAKRVQLAGGTFDVESFLVGLVRELRVDTSNDSLRLHDGVKVGGFEFLNRDAISVLYQARSTELDGFSFGAQEKGIVTRVGPATYRIRRIEVNEGNLVITNPRGTLGNYYFSFADTIETDHTFTGLITFTQPIAAEGGIVGDLIGDVTGDLTGDSTGTHNGPSFGLHTGSVFVPDGDTITGADDSIAENMIHQLIVNRGVPYGCIVMWSGIIADIPDTWALCDGTGGTPDLRDRFVVGAGTTYDPLETGGSATLSGTGTIELGGAHDHSLVIADHTLTLNEIPEHYHGAGLNDGSEVAMLHGSIASSGAATQRIDTTDGGLGVEPKTTTVGAGDPHTHTGSTASDDGIHSHDITLDDVVSLPPYFALCFIMKIAAD